jgi:hypothetical protein
LQLRSLHGNNVLHTLVARQNKMSNATGQALGTMLLQNRMLRHISLSWNAIGPTSGAAIASGLMYSNTLTVRAACLPASTSMPHLLAPSCHQSCTVLHQAATEVAPLLVLAGQLLCVR